jgi:hypothetical protein
MTRQKTARAKNNQKLRSSSSEDYSRLLLGTRVTHMVKDSQKTLRRRKPALDMPSHLLMLVSDKDGGVPESAAVEDAELTRSERIDVNISKCAE